MIRKCANTKGFWRKINKGLTFSHNHGVTENTEKKLYFCLLKTNPQPKNNLAQRRGDTKPTTPHFFVELKFSTLTLTLRFVFSNMTYSEKLGGFIIDFLLDFWKNILICIIVLRPKNLSKSVESCGLKKLR